MNNKSNMDTAMPGRGDGSVARLLKKLAENKNIKVASKIDDNTPEGIDIRRVIDLSQAYDEAVRDGFKGNIEEFIRSLPEDELRQFFNSGGKVISFISEKEKRRPEKSIRKLDLASKFAPDTTLAELDENQRATLNALLKLTFGKKD